MDKNGYIDTQMIWENFNQVPCFTFGPGSNTAHQPNEFVKIDYLNKSELFFKKLINTYGQ